ncbi:GNAT family N-acetyltransferase [bacterium]|nr:GNAT family N-acetyltransferase [bacterium]MBU1958896.1 GNAT family N-acetyltransferase [bacterium]
MKNNKIDFYIKSLSQEKILNFLEKNNKSHYKKLSDVVNLDAYAEKISKHAMHFTLYDKEKLIGFSACYFNDDKSKVGYISGISLLEGYRGLGLASQLVTNIIEYGKQNSFKEININPDCNNSVLIDFFLKNGFVKYEKINDRCLLKYSIKENM